MISSLNIICKALKCLVREDYSAAPKIEDASSSVSMPIVMKL
jgi:hypothetical protein